MQIILRRQSEMARIFLAVLSLLHGSEHQARNYPFFRLSFKAVQQPGIVLGLIKIFRLDIISIAPYK